MSNGKRIIPNPYDFSLLKNKFNKLGISWDPRKGKGGHGTFIGLDQNGEKQAYPIPGIKNEQGQVGADYLKNAREQFGLGGDKWHNYFADPKAKPPK